MKTDWVSILKGVILAREQDDFYYDIEMHIFFDNVFEVHKREATKDPVTGEENIMVSLLERNKFA